MVQTFRSTLILFLLFLSPVFTWPQSNQITFLTYNIHHGEGVDTKLDLPRIADVIRSVSPHVVALQEVDRNTGRVQGSDQIKELGEILGMDYRYAKAIDYDGGEYGHGVLSHLPIVRFTSHLLPLEKGAEQRALTETELQFQNRNFLFFGTHLDHVSEHDRQLGAQFFVNLLDKMKLPAILAGDLNAVPDSGTIKTLLEKMQLSDPTLQPTFSSTEPKRKIDYILYTPAEQWKVIETRVIPEEVASDHRPYMAILEFQEHPSK